ncbi:MAG TPA: outer membrane protein assembly factor BamD [Verrucomicrobiae bacterium]|jgi:outer membrane protein assembly factor BamD|nr:outer membrane protein assembly factor BamD [Verrucomicrobiae bacterium]
MNRRLVFLLLAFASAMLIPFRSPAPLIYTPGEGWTYESVGGVGNWQRTRAKDQLIVAQDAYDKKDYSTALKAARRTVRIWPLSDYAPQAQFVVGECYEARGFDERAFKEYQVLLEKYPRFVDCEKVLTRQYEIANRFLAGEWFRLWTYIPFFPSMERTADMYGKIVKDGPFSDIAPQAQMKIGAAREKQKNFPDAAKAYETAADRYHDRGQIAADAMFRAGLAYQKQAQTAEYDQSTAGQSIATFTDFMTLYPDDPRVPEAQKIITSLKEEQARGNFTIGQYYEEHGKWVSAKIYYNEVVNLLLGEPNSLYATQARVRIEALNKRIQPDTK